MSLEEEANNVSEDFYRQDYEGLKTLLYVGLIFGSVVVASKVYDLKYGKTAEENWRSDSIKEVMYRDSVNKSKQDTTYHLKMVPKTLKY